MATSAPASNESITPIVRNSPVRGKDARAEGTARETMEAAGAKKPRCASKV